MQLYDTYGDTVAKDRIDDCLSFMMGFVVQHNGVVIKTIGDEIMCRFESADEAISAACAIQENIDQPLLDSKIPIAVRIGLHYGKAIIKNQDIFGDAVNIAARMVEISKPGQIITTKAIADQLSTPYKGLVRQYDYVTVKGLHDKLIIFDVLWDNTDLTIIGNFQADQVLTNQTLLLEYKQQKQRLTIEDASSFIIGRGANCNMVISSDLVSRTHAKIDHQRGKFVLLDQSTNGTYVKHGDETEVYLRREALLLRGTGVISFGMSTLSEKHHTMLSFECQRS